MADKKINVVFDASVKANVGNLKGIVNKLQNELNNLEMPNGVTKGFEKEIKTLVNELQIFESLTTGGIGNLGDAKKVNASWEKISSTLRTIGIQIDDLKLSPANIFSKEVGANINKATKGLNEYLAKVEKIKKENGEYQNIQAKKRKAEDALPDLRKEASKDRKNADAARRKYENRQEVWDKQYKDDYEKLEQEISDKDKQLQAKEKEIATLKSRRQEFRNQGIIGQEKNNLKDSEIASLRLAEKIAEYDEAEAKAAEAEKEYLALKRSASGKKGYYTKQKKLHGENSEEAKKAKEVSEQAENAAKNAKAAMEAAQEAFQSKSPITQEARDSLPDNIKQLQEAEKVLLDLKEAQNKFNQLKSEKEEKEGARSEEAKTFKRNLGRAENDARIAEQLAQQTEDSLKKAEDEIVQLEGKLSQIETEGTVEEWQKLINIVKELTGQDLSEAGRDIEVFKQALEDYKTKELEKTPQTLEEISTTAKSTAGSMSEVGRAVDSATTSFKDLTREQQDMERFKDNILDFFSIGNTIQIFKNALRDAFDTVKELDAAMTETAVVTDFSIGDMWEKLPEYSKTASDLGSSIKDLYGATTLYYQQGLNTEQAMSVGIETMKMARIANMEGADATKAMTAALRGFNMEINETSAKRVNDVYSELAAITAADTQQIATAMTKTASIADSANMDFEVTAALLAQIIETTQEAPETAGTALKTIIARFTEVKELFSEGMLTGKDSEGEAININKIDAALQTVGISLKDFLNGSKGIDDIFLELASKWDTLDLATQRYIATTAAGSRQQSRFIAMMSNYDRTMELVGAANDSAGASNEQFDKTLDSLDAKLERLNNAWQEFTMNLANNELIKFGVDFLANFLETINSITEALSGGNGMVKSILTLGEVVVGLKTGKNIFNSIFRGISSSLPEETQVPWWMHLFSGGEGQGQKGKFKVFQNGLSELGNVAKVIGDINRGLENPKNIKLPKKITDIATGVTDWFNNEYRGGWQASRVLSDERRQRVAEALTSQDFVEEETAQDVLEMLGDADSSDSFQEILGLFGEDFEAQMSEIFDFDTIAEEGFDSVKNGFKNLFDDGIAKAKTFGSVLKKAFTSPLGKLSLLVGAGMALYKTWEYFNLDNQEKRAQENLKEIKSAASIERSKLSQLSEEKTSYQTMKEEIDGLVEGSLEWKQAVSDLNEKTLDLKSRYSELEISKKDGLFSIDDSSWDSIINKQQKAVDTLDNTKIMAQMQVDEVAFKKSLNKVVQSSNLSKGFSFASENIYSLLSADAMYNVLGQYSGGLKKVDSSYQEALSQERALYDSIKESRRKEIVETSISDDISEANSELVSNLITKGGISWGRDGEYNKSVEDRVDSYMHSYDFWSENALQKEYAEKIGGVYKGGKLYTDKTYSEEITLDKSGLKQALATNKTMDQISEYSEQLNQSLKTLNTQQKEQLKELFSTEGQDITTSTLREFYQNGQLDKQAFENFAKENGFDSTEDMAKKLGMSVDTFYDSIESNLNMAKSRVEKQRKNVVKNLSQYGNTLNGQVTDDAAMLALLEAKFGDYILETFDSAIKSLEYTGDKDLISAGIQGLQATAQYGTKADVEQIANFINEVNWSSPIEAASALNDELKTGTNLTKEFAQGMLNVNSSFLGAGSQIQHLWDTASDTGLSEALDEIIAANGEITGADIAGLTKDYQSLDKMLKNTGISASGVAKALDMISKGEMNIQSLTNAVAASLAGFGGLSDMINDVISQIGEWDMGTDEGQIGDFASQLYETANELISSGQRGNTQLDKIFGLVYGHDYLRGKVGDERKAALEAGLEGIAGLKDGNMSSIWNKIGTLDASVQEQAGNLRVSYKNGEAFIDGYEGMTTAQIVENIRNLSQAAGFSDNEMFAKMLLGDASNYSDYIRPILSQNDLELGLDRAYDAANEHKGQKVMDESEIEAIAQLYNEDASEVRNKLLQQAKENGEKIAFTDFYDENGQLKDTEGILQEIVNTQIKLSGTTDKVAYTTEGWIKRFGEGSQESSLRVHELQQELANMGVPDDKIDQMTEDIVDGLLNVEDEATVEVEFPDGSVKDITVKAGQSFAQAYEQAMKQFEYDSIGKAIASAFVDMDIDASGIYEEVHGAVEEANEDAIITIKNEGAEEITSAINTAIDNANKTVKLNVSPTTIEISGSASGAIHLNAYKDGIVNASYTHPALVGEEGPELVETANGAYLAGVGGPEVTNINKGDTVHTAGETKKILKGNRHKQIPRFSNGKSGPTLHAYGDMLKGSGGSGKDDAWETSIDKLYNLLREIQEETRYRNSIERRYERMLESLDVSATQLVSLSRQELSQLQEEKQLQEQLIKGRQDQIAEYMQDNQDFAKYAWVEQNERGEDVLRIDWEMINGITDKKLGEDVSKYLSQLEGWFGDIEGAQDSIDEIDDQLFEINQRGKDEYFDLEEKIKDALVQSYQDEIDKLSEINDTINDTNSQIIQSIQDSVSRMRQERENQQTEEDLDTLRQRLSYLQQDTSGANAQEILELQKEIDEKSQDYTDSLIDQKITKLQEQNDDAAEQRKMQIEVMQQQLDHLEKTGEIWTEVQTLMDEGLHPDGGLVGGSKLEEILQKSENFAGLSTLGKMKWLEETNRLVAQGLGYLYQGRQLENLGLETGSTIQFVDSEGNVLSGELLDGGDVKVGDKVYKDIYQSYDGKYYSLGQAEDYVTPEKNLEKEIEIETVEPSEKLETPGPGVSMIEKQVIKTNNAGEYIGSWTLTDPERTETFVATGSLNEIEKRYPKYSRYWNSWIWETVKVPAYKKGGLADFTGPAWLDGTKSRPEYILNASQTKSFFTLVDALESLKYKPSNNQTENYGDTIYDIDINIETVKEEADVDMLVDKVQKSIVKASQYRNTNLIRR